MVVGCVVEEKAGGGEKNPDPVRVMVRVWQERGGDRTQTRTFPSPSFLPVLKFLGRNRNF